ncbi:MAG: prepilin-type N-terminal cleavage/methylation domain-containing protein [Candidatus Omnitrophota bacterium]
MKRGFTLIEIIIVIIIVGILAAVGLTQYAAAVERPRGAEGKTILGDIRKFAYQYWIENGSVTSVTQADLNIGTAPEQFPSACRSSHYFRYVCYSPSSSSVLCAAYRCTSGGKTPNRAGNAFIMWTCNLSTGIDNYYGCCNFGMGTSDFRY